MDDRRRDRAVGQHVGRRAGASGAVAGEEHHAVGVLHDALQAVLGDHDGDAEVVDEAGDRGEHLLGRGGIERGGRLVEHQHPGVGGEHRADGDALLLAARQGPQGSVAQLGDAEQVERLLDPLAHHVGRHRELLHRVGELLLDGVGDEPGERVLADDADDVGEVARAVGAGVAPVDDDAPGEVAAGEVRDEAVDGAEQRRLPGAGAADHEAQLALVDREVDVAQAWARRRRRR